jgi:hypothetical protein
LAEIVARLLVNQHRAAIVQPQGRLTCFKIDDEAHANPCRQGQLVHSTHSSPPSLGLAEQFNLARRSSAPRISSTGVQFLPNRLSYYFGQGHAVYGIAQCLIDLGLIVAAGHFRACLENLKFLVLLMPPAP